MKQRANKILNLFVVAVASLSVLSGTANAVDGVKLITQARAMAGNVTPGDAPGFPVTLSRSGSYRLAGNLTVPDENTIAIQLVYPGTDVILDLNGFVIKGPNYCQPKGEGICDLGTGTGIISMSGSNLTVHNGTIFGVGNDGISCDRCRVEKVKILHNPGNGIFATSGTFIDNVITHNFGDGIRAYWLESTVLDNTTRLNGGNGISVGNASLVKGNRANRNGQKGIEVSEGGAYGPWSAALVIDNVAMDNGNDGINTRVGSTIKNNIVNNNGYDGIDAHAASLVSENTTRGNGEFGLRLGERVGYTQNVITDNGAGNAYPQVSGGIEMGTNLCGTNTTCP